MHKIVEQLQTLIINCHNQTNVECTTYPYTQLQYLTNIPTHFGARQRHSQVVPLKCSIFRHSKQLSKHTLHNCRLHTDAQLKERYLLVDKKLYRFLKWNASLDNGVGGKNWIGVGSESGKTWSPKIMVKILTFHKMWLVLKLLPEY
jgi:hypothetical protein